MRAVEPENGAVRAHLADLQRARILAATFDVAAELGASNITVAHIVARSGVSRRTFYELFTDREDCLLAAFDQALVYASARVLPAYREGGVWRERIRAALVDLLAFLDEQPTIGRLLMVESLAGGPRVLERRSEVLRVLTGAVDEGRTEAKASAPLPLTAEGTVGGVLAVIQSRMAQPRRESMVELTNPLMSMIVLPYLGSGAARRELERQVSVNVSAAGRPVLMGDPFKEAGMRLTYRTVRVLIAIAANPGASNRTIGEIAGIEDQGQISKLLGRLKRGGLVSNTGLGPGTGAPNAWVLTEKGRQVVQNISAHTEGSR